MTPTQLLTSALESAYLRGIDDFLDAGPRIGGSKSFPEKARDFAETKTAEVLAGTRQLMLENGLSAPKDEEEEVDDGFSFSLPLPGNRRFVLRGLGGQASASSTPKASPIFRALTRASNATWPDTCASRA